MDLVQIGDMPPLRQSTVEVMGCPKFYVTSKIEGREQPGGLESARGTQVHNVHALYASWCATKGVSQDLAAFDRFSQGVGHAAHKILVGMRDGLEIDFKHLLATELSMSLDDNFMPTDVVEAIEGTVGDSGEPAAYQGTLDAVYVFQKEKRIHIDDAKTHPRPFDPSDTLQGKMYSLFVFQHFPWVQEVRFRLIFVRYRNLYKEVLYTRSDVPALIEIVRSARARQQMIHDDYDAEREIDAIPGSHCLSGDTRFLTSRGVMTLKDASGEKVKVLNRHGVWEQAEVRSFGIQKLMRITFDDGSVVRATKGHRWWKMERHKQNDGWNQTDERITTMELTHVPVVKFSEVPDEDEEGIRHGFIYGDGYHRAGRDSCIALIHPPKDEHMLKYFPGAHIEKGRNRYKKGGMPGHFKTLRGITSPSYARGFLAGVIAADGSVCQNGGVHLYCEGREKAYLLAEIVRFGAGVVSSISLHSDKPTNYSPKGAVSRELMRIDIKPSTAPVITPSHRCKLKTKNQMRRMYREVVSIEEDAFEEVFCAVVPGSESFTLANGIATSNCQYCPLLSNRKCPISEFNPAMQLSYEDRLKFSLWYKAFSTVNTKAMKERVDATGRSIILKDFNGKIYKFGPEEKESMVYPLFKRDGKGIELDAQDRPVMPIIDLLTDHAYALPEDTEWMTNLLISGTKLKSYLGAKKRVLLDGAVKDVADTVTKVKMVVSKPLDALDEDEEFDEDEDEEEF